MRKIFMGFLLEQVKQALVNQLQAMFEWLVVAAD
jgi:hypothetical protein